MARLNLRIHWQIRAGGNLILEPSGKIDLSLAESLDMSPVLFQIFRHRRGDYATRLQNLLSACENPPVDPQV